MTRAASSEPPRPIRPGDIVAAYSEALGEWTAAQITDLDIESKTAGVLELDWSGAEPSSVTELGRLAPLRLTHHNWDGRLSHTNHEWVLPRSHKVVGATGLLHAGHSMSYSGWNLGQQLAYQRRWDGGDRGPWSDPRFVATTGEELNRLLDGRQQSRPGILNLRVKAVTTLDCRRLAERYPGLTGLTLSGDFGVLVSAVSLNDVPLLKRLSVTGLFGMEARDCLLPDRVPGLEFLSLYSIPAAYAAAMRARWRLEVANGTLVDITGARRPEWVAENISNPLREWDGRAHISGTRFEQAVNQYKATRRAVMAACAHEVADERRSMLAELGRAYAEAFNGMDSRRPFIETVEREELFAALDLIVDEAEAALGVELSAERDSLREGAETAREW